MKPSFGEPCSRAGSGLMRQEASRNAFFATLTSERHCPQRSVARPQRHELRGMADRPLHTRCFPRPASGAGNETRSLGLQGDIGDGWHRAHDVYVVVVVGKATLGCSRVCRKTPHWPILENMRICSHGPMEACCVFSTNRPIGIY
jgi:hypothetical protein